jgi:hypothetical protein
MDQVRVSPRSRKVRSSSGTGSTTRSHSALRTLFSAIRRPAAAALLLAALAEVSQAGFGRQSMTVSADYEPGAVCRWLETHVDQIIQSTGADILQSRGDLIELRVRTKQGDQTMTLRRQIQPGVYSATFVNGTLEDYIFRIRVAPAEEGNGSELTVETSATVSDVSGISINIELRRSLRMIRGYLETHLRRQ